MLLYKEGVAEGKTVAEQFASALAYVDRVDVLVGFFFFSGMKALEAALREHPEVRMRVLVGMGAEVLAGQVVEVAWDEEASREERLRAAVAQLERALGSGALERKGFLARVGFFLELLEAGRLEVRQTAHPNHAKLWLFHNAPEHRTTWGEGKFIVGSSNFSWPALASETQAELDVELKDWGYAEAQGYFDALWETAFPLEAQAIAEVLRRRRPLLPFEAYALALDTVVRTAPEDAALSQRITQALRRAGYGDFAYQRDAVVQACAILERFHGALLADVVGLGKSVIASVIASVAPSGRYGLILCPPGLVENWKAYRKDFGLGQWEIFSYGTLEPVKELLARDPGYGMVIVDEAHRFRNAKSERYADLHAICEGRDTLLLTATPLNNHVADLEALLSLFLPRMGNPLVYGGDLEAYFGDLDRKLKACHAALRKASHLGEARPATGEIEEKALLAAGLDGLTVATLRGRTATEAALRAAHRRHLGRLRAVLEQVTIRRNRIDLIHDPIYGKSLPSLSTVHDPERVFFALSDAQDAFYDRVVSDAFGGLAPHWKGPLYQPESYTAQGSRGQNATQGNIRAMILRMLVRRFESSFAAFRRSVENMWRMYQTAQDFILRTGTYLYTREAMEDLLEEDDSEAFEQRLTDVIENLVARGKAEHKGYVYDLSAKGFRKQAFLDDIASDLRLFEQLLKEMKRLRLEEEDPKAAQLVATCRAILAGTALSDGNPAAPKRKVLIFSEFADTVAALGTVLEAAFPGRVCVVRTLTKELRGALRANFDASCPPGERRDDFDLLLGTDKLSEGLNLNRAGVVINYDIPWNPTRVLQRLGRINRIGQKVFDDLYTVNFFPTRRGSDLVGNERIAKEKLFAIHKTLGEDVKLFESGEEPTAAELWERLNTSQEKPSPMVYWRRLHAELAEAHPGLLARVRTYAPHAKSAFVAQTGESGGTLWQLRALGHLTQALVHDAAGNIRPVPPLELLEALKCDPDTPLNAAALHAAPFWDALKALANYRPARTAPRSQQSSKAVGTLDALEQTLPEQGDAIRALRAALHHGALPAHSINTLARLSINTPAEVATAAKTLERLAANLRLAGLRPDARPVTTTLLSVWRMEK